MRIRRFLGVLLAMLLVVGCAKPPVESLFPAKEYPEWKIEWNLSAVAVEDKREKEVLDKRRAARQDEGAFRPVEVSSGTEAEMEKRVRSVVVGGPKDLFVKINVVAGGAGISEETYPKLVAHTSARIEIEFIHRKSGNLVFKSFGEAAGEHSSYEIPADEPDRIFQSAALAAFDKALVSPAVRRAFANFVEPSPKPEVEAPKRENVAVKPEAQKAEAPKVEAGAKPEESKKEATSEAPKADGSIPKSESPAPSATGKESSSRPTTPDRR